MTIWQFAACGCLLGFCVGSWRCLLESWDWQESWATKLGYSAIFGVLAAGLGTLWHLPGVF